MQRFGAELNLSAGDLVGHLNCRYLTELDLKVANGELERPKVWDPALEVLAERGELHEQGFIEHLKSGGSAITVVEGIGVDAKSVAATIEAMGRGDAIIVQGALQAGRWNGRADVLRRVDTPSWLGAWSYEVIDTKLARETKGNTILQISLYSNLLAETQKLDPASAFVVTPGTNFVPEAYRIADYAAYYRHVRGSLERAVSSGAVAGGAYPDPIEHCEICQWRRRCDEKRRGDDHLSLVAGISKTQIAELARRGVPTVAALAVLAIPLPWRPDRGAVQSYEKVREQARIQVDGRAKGLVLHETLPPVPGFGLARLPEPSPGDIFFDFEGDPFVGDGGLEFLFGYVYLGADGSERYVGDWASNRQHERAAFERFVDFVTERLRTFPDLRIYHYAPYEPAAMKRLMGRYASRESEVDNLLRSETFVDLYAVVRHGIRASVESYSIKKLEPLYAFARTVPLEDVGAVMARTQARLEMADPDGIAEADKVAIIGYNRDDCASTRALRNWLESVRAELIAGGATIERPSAAAVEISEELDDWQKRVAALVARLTDGVPDDVAERTSNQQARWLLAFMLDWHGRENKAVWWEYFRLRDLSSEDLLHERAGLADLTFVKQVGGTVKVPIHRYQFALQDTDIRADSELRSVGGEKFGRAVAVSFDDRTIDVKKRGDTADFHPDAVFAHSFVNTKVLAESLMRIGEYVADHGMEGDGEHRACRDLLLAVAPRLRGQEIQCDGEAILATAIRIARNLDRSVFPVQGPPGAGKTFTGARMICTLAGEGKRIGITANSHKVIRNLFDGVVVATDEQGLKIKCIQNVPDKENDLPGLRFTTDNSTFLQALGADCQVGGGTAWFWARPDARLCVDVLFIDEAAQMSLANVLAVSQAAESVILLGDPRQLEQPIKGSHPDGVDVSALDHILGSHATVPPERGLFLEQTWRLHPSICAFNSELFYDGRLRAQQGLENQQIKSTGRVNGNGLRYLGVDHSGNQSSSPEEADEVRDLVAEILGTGTTWINRSGGEAPIALDDILIIAPYNAQVFELQERIPGARIGTVDKFQGQEAPIVIYSMTTSSHADAPRGMEFLYSANRLNVATSRAKCICIVVASPRLFEAECRTPRQMQLANAFCRYLELAAEL
ncbi:TM0106 family RecB-like putative nuclease [Bradyrhizobium sp. AUGA SZCCT0431]|uniref:TM0106 family RecB-like putative nuclease n=1 Tax=Bradyrhizobium sp. AUGA SZCCT0431 TaxID=2807674 RepID=UPI001BA68B2A|nr:TM0106 family RecB-like putative nuclease [Bradyrhizobium sp. AUGA SZCCT0431]MBR1146136.1 TM0106 family RecB-like putative nuclease [Bradyrhizobium sp. AUGA SZCCT0431]